MKKILETFILLLIVALVAACSKEAPMADKATSNAVSENARGEFDKAAPSESASPASASELANQVERGRRLVIHNANLSVTVEDPKDAANQAQGIADTLGGFVVSSNSNGTESMLTSTITIRVPSDAFDSALNRFRQLGVVQHENISGQDVTAEFVDLQSRLEVQRNLESRYLTLLQNAATVEDAITVEKELARVRTEIEQMEGRQKYLANQAQLATISVDFSREHTVTEKGRFDVIGDAFSDSGDIVVTVIAGTIRVLSALLPIAALIFLLGLGIVKLVNRRRNFDDV